MLILESIISVQIKWGVGATYSLPDQEGSNSSFATGFLGEDNADAARKIVEALSNYPWVKSARIFSEGGKGTLLQNMLSRESRLNNEDLTAIIQAVQTMKPDLEITP